MLFLTFWSSEFWSTQKTFSTFWFRCSYQLKRPFRRSEISGLSTFWNLIWRSDPLPIKYPKFSKRNDVFCCFGVTCRKRNKTKRKEQKDKHDENDESSVEVVATPTTATTTTITTASIVVDSSQRPSSTTSRESEAEALTSGYFR